MLGRHRHDLKKLNTMTKYPSIPTYHVIDGTTHRLREDVAVSFDFGEQVYISEKIDGTNTRMIFTPGGWLIGSRDELLYAQGDIIGNPSQGIVEAVHELASKIGSYAREDVATIWVIYGEVYGGKINGAKNYTATGRLGFRAFDVAIYERSLYDELFEQPIEKIAAWRDAGGQRFWPVERVQMLARDMEVVPPINAAPPIPTSLHAAHAWMKELIPVTHAPLDGVIGKPEGLVVRTADRKKIAKLRFEDYERALRGKAR